MPDNLSSPGVLLSTAHDKLSHLITTDLTRRGVRVEGIGPQCPAVLRLAGQLTQFHRAPPLDDTARFVDRVCDVMSKRRLDVFLPSCREVNRLAPFQPRLAQEANYPFPDERITKAVSNKAELADLAERHGIAAPPTLPVSSDILDRAAELCFPLICKPKRSCNSRGLRVVSSPEALRSYLAGKTDDYLVQEYIDGSLIVWNGVYSNGALHSVFAFEAVRTSPAQCGVSVLRKAIHIPALDAIAIRLLSALGYEGFCSLDFMRDRRKGQYFLIDFNPRFPSSLHASLHAGISFPWILLNLVLGRQCPGCDYADGVVTMSLSGHIGRILRRRPGGPRFAALLGDTLTALRWLHQSEESYLLRPFPFAGPIFCAVAGFWTQAKRLGGQILEF